mmetsp:Transcript_19510/g.42151  ORF Transcript_19510/g.42151 Transcript_19510/m.42151 type:complete len:205 (+) Transcript_19510:425-1039(+)
MIPPMMTKIKTKTAATATAATATAATAARTVASRTTPPILLTIPLPVRQAKTKPHRLCQKKRTMKFASPEGHVHHLPKAQTTQTSKLSATARPSVVGNPSVSSSPILQRHSSASATPRVALRTRDIRNSQRTPSLDLLHSSGTHTLETCRAATTPSPPARPPRRPRGSRSGTAKTKKTSWVNILQRVASRTATEATRAASTTAL